MVLLVTVKRGGTYVLTGDSDIGGGTYGSLVTNELVM